MNTELNAEIVLPLETFCPIKYDLCSHFPLHILFGNEKTKVLAQSYIVNQYTQIHCLNSNKIIQTNDKLDYKNIHICYPYNPYILVRKKKLKFKTKQELIGFIIETIKNKQYISLKLDQFYLKGYLQYNKNHQIHTEYIYGYNKNSRTFYLFGSPNLILNTFDNRIVSFDEVADAYFNCNGANAEISLLSYKYSHKTRSNSSLYNIRKIKHGLSKYYFSTDCFLSFFFKQFRKIRPHLFEITLNHVYGINVVKEIIKLIYYEINEDTPNNINYSKYLQVMVDFYYIMNIRVTVIFEKDNSELKNRCKIIYDNYYLAKMFYLKYAVTHKKENLKKCITYLEKNYFLEKEFGSILLYKLEEMV